MIRQAKRQYKNHEVHSDNLGVDIIFEAEYENGNEGFEGWAINIRDVLRKGVSVYDQDWNMIALTEEVQEYIDKNY